MTDPTNAGTQRTVAPQPDPAEVFEEAMTSGVEREPTERDQHAARDRRSEQMTGPDDGRISPNGMSHVGGP